MNKRKTFAVLLVLAGLVNQVHAFQLSPVGTEAERRFAKRWGTTIRVQISIGEKALHNFADPVHETLTQRTFDCDGDWSDCANPDLEYAGPYVIAGVRWNDDPVFLLKPGEAQGLPCVTRDTISFITQTRCWLGLFRDAETKARADPEYFLRPNVGTYMSRSHFGDLQFLHAMAAIDGESAEHTRERILMWAEFVWEVIEGRFELGTYLRDIRVSGWQDHFANNHTVQDLFTMGRPWLRPHIKEVAFGSLLHLVQDSFSKAHVDRREPIAGEVCLNGTTAVYGRIREFHSYASQDHGKHKAADSNERARQAVQLENPDVIDAGRKLREFLGKDASWSDVREFLSQCLLVLDEESGPASPGDEFR